MLNKIIGVFHMHSFDVDSILLRTGAVEVLPPKGRSCGLPPPGCMTRKGEAFPFLALPFPLIPMENASRIGRAPPVGTVRTVTIVRPWIL